jgi:ribosomal protein L37AE/L43A
MSPLAVGLVACAAGALLLVAANWLTRERCPRCGSRRTFVASAEHGLWLCEGCLRYFGPGSIGFYKDHR